MSIQLAAPPRGILLDIEGTTSSIAFVHDVMFPFALEHLDAFLQSQFERPDVRGACEQIAQDAGMESLSVWSVRQSECSPRQLVADEVRRLMADDVKATGLKSLQGLVWEDGFHSGVLKAHVFDDVLPAIRGWRERGLDVRIYSSGSIAAQKLFFGHLESAGDCLSLFTGHYDTTIGGKKDPDSYTRLAADWGIQPEQILFISDVAAELQAAGTAGLQTLASVRPGNAALPDESSFAQISSFDQVPC